MAVEFVMPKLGLTMEEGTIVEWLVDDGAEVNAGASVLRIETDKTETDVEATASGRLVAVGTVGDTYASGDQIGWILAEGEAVPSSSSRATPPPSVSAADTPSTGVGAVAARAATANNGGRIFASPNARRLARQRGLDLHAVRGTGPNGRIVAADLAPAGPGEAAVTSTTAIPAAAKSVMPGPYPPATVAARQLADLLGVDLWAVEVDPIDGRVTRDGVARHVRSMLAVAGRASADSPAGHSRQSGSGLPPPTQQPSSVIKLSGMRGTIAKRMLGSLRDMAQLTLHMDADLDAVFADREARTLAGEAPSYTDYVIAATARALVAHPVINSQITEDGVALLPTVNVGMAVALERGLIVPVISGTADLGLDELRIESARLAAAARDGSLSRGEVEGGTFSVSTLGMFGVDGFTPVINPPNTAILGVGRLRDDLVMSDGGVTSVKRLTLSLTWDHRAFDGAPAAAFCRSIVEQLADPTALG